MKTLKENIKKVLLYQLAIAVGLTGSSKECV